MGTSWVPVADERGRLHERDGRLQVAPPRGAVAAAAELERRGLFRESRVRPPLVAAGAKEVGVFPEPLPAGRRADAVEVQAVAVPGAVGEEVADGAGADRLVGAGVDPASD